MKGPTPRRLRQYVAKCRGLKFYLQRPGDGRSQGRIPAAALLGALLMGALLRRAAFAGIEALVRSRARRALDVCQRFGDDALAYFTERLAPAVTRRAMVTAVRQAKRHKAFDDSRFIGLALDGTRAGRSREKGCDLCRPYRNQQKEILGYHHRRVMTGVVGTGLTLPLDIEPYGPGDSEYNAARRLRSCWGIDLTFVGPFSILRCFGSTAQDSRQTSQAPPRFFRSHLQSPKENDHARHN